jgi:hypothetical protein
MAGFLCRVVDSDEIPVPGIRVTMTSLQNPAIVAFDSVLSSFNESSAYS